MLPVHETEVIPLLELGSLAVSSVPEQPVLADKSADLIFECSPIRWVWQCQGGELEGHVLCAGTPQLMLLGMFSFQDNISACDLGRPLKPCWRQHPSS